MPGADVYHLDCIMEHLREPMIKTFYLNYNHHEPAEAKANNEMDSPFYGMDEEHCDNVINTLYELAVDIDVTTGKIVEIRSNFGGQTIKP